VLRTNKFNCSKHYPPISTNLFVIKNNSVTFFTTLPTYFSEKLSFVDHSPLNEGPYEIYATFDPNKNAMRE
jgi:hypothetical protein